MKFAYVFIIIMSLLYHNNNNHKMHKINMKDKVNHVEDNVNHGHTIMIRPND